MTAQRPCVVPGPATALGELSASLVTFFVALPLSMGIALASGAPVMTGLLSAALGGLVVGALSGVPLQVSGPAAGMAVLAYTNIERFGLRAACGITLLAGLLQLALGAARVARLALALSPAVLHGMMAGIGVQLALAQLRVVLGGTPQATALANLRALPAQLAHAGPGSTLLGVLTAAVLLGVPWLLRGRLRAVPPAMLAVLVGTVAATLTGAAVARVELPAQRLSVLALPALPAHGLWVPALLAAVTLALVASAETLLSSVATDRLHSGPRAKLDRELVAQGVGNTLAGLLGGLPVTGVVVRTTANINAGARTRASTMMHGAWIVLSVLLLGGLLRRVPLAVLGALLVVQGLSLVRLEHLRELRHYQQLAVYLTTLAGVVLVNLLAGILLGVALSAAQLLYRLTRVEAEAAPSGDGWRVTVRGPLTFLGVPTLHAALARVPRGARVALRLGTPTLDHAAHEAVSDWRRAHERTGGTVIDEPTARPLGGH